jgi:outer membrane protein assembly factor BamB
MLGGDVSHSGRSHYTGPSGPNVALKWKTTIGAAGSIYSSPVIGPDGNVYVAKGSTMYALDGSTGAQKWNRTAGGAISSTPVMSPTGALCYGSGDSAVQVQRAVPLSNES